MIVVVEEMKKFRELLDKNGIEWIDDSEEERDDVWICRTHSKNHDRWSVINGIGTYGGYSIGEKNEGLLEAAIDDKVLGHLKAEEAYKLVEIIEWSERANNGQKI